MIATVALANASMTSHNHLFLVVAKMEVKSLGDCEVHNTHRCLLSLCCALELPDLFIHHSQVHALKQHLPSFPAPPPGNHHSSLCFYRRLDLTYKWCHTVFVGIHQRRENIVWYHLHVESNTNFTLKMRTQRSKRFRTLPNIHTILSRAGWTGFETWQHDSRAADLNYCTVLCLQATKSNRFSCFTVHQFPVS